MTEGEKGKEGFQKKYKDEEFIKVLTEKPQTTSQIKDELRKKRGYKTISQDWVLKTLLRIADEPDSKIIKDEIRAASRTGKMYLWRKEQ